jgi:uroporphyrinogen-III decarboxylase
MRYEVNIDYPVEKMAASLKRMQARADFKYADRVPVNFCIEPRYIAPFLGIEYGDLFRDPVTQYEYWLKMAKWQIENVPSDACCAPVIVVWPYFDNVKQGSAFGCEVTYSKTETLQTKPFMHDVSEIDNMYLPGPRDGLFGKYIDWWFKMQELTRVTKVTFNGQPGQVVMQPMSIATLSPHMVAVDIAGTELYYWMAAEPEMYHQMLDKITKNTIECEHYIRKLYPVNWQGFGQAEDTSTILSREMYREMVMPYTLRMYREFGSGMRNGRGMHMCGPSTHLLDILADEVHITDFNVFGFPVKPEDAAAKLGGKVQMWGNINPMLMQTGTRSEVKAACLNALRSIAPCGGFMLGDGANVAPNTPLENLAAFTEAAEEYGTPAIDPKYGKKRNYEFV